VQKLQCTEPARSCSAAKANWFTGIIYHVPACVAACCGRCECVCADTGPCYLQLRLGDKDLRAVTERGVRGESAGRQAGLACLELLITCYNWLHTMLKARQIDRGSSWVLMHAWP
jgi:hypothetical protein